MTPITQRVALGLCYDGTAWHGWQKQPSGHTVQNQLELALAQFLATPTATVCAGRTDAGVHALNQVVHLDTHVTARASESWLRGLNALLPKSISVQWIKTVPDDFHARFSAQRRQYIYILRNARVRSPLLHNKVGWVFRPLDLEAMRLAAQHFLGTHDFTTFRAAECQAKTALRHLQQLDIHQVGDFFVFEFGANAFLQHMIRNIMGALVYVGLRRQNPSWIPYLLEQKNRHLSAPTFSPEGLYLAGVDYPESYGLPKLTSAQLCEQHLGVSFSL